MIRIVFFPGRDYRGAKRLKPHATAVLCRKVGDKITNIGRYIITFYMRK